MRVLELAFIAAAVLLAHFAVGLSAITGYLCAVGIALFLQQVAALRHRQVFIRSREPGVVVHSFRTPSAFGNPMPYSVFRCRRWYTALARAKDGSERDYDVMVEGTFFGLFWIDVVVEANLGNAPARTGI